MLHDRNHFNIYDYHRCHLVNVDPNHVHIPGRKIWKPNSSSSLGWLPEGREGVDLRNALSKKTKGQMITLLEYVNLNSNVIPNTSFKTLITKTGGRVIHNSGIWKCTCSNQVGQDLNSCGIIAFFGKNARICSCSIRSLLRSIISTNPQKLEYLSLGLNTNETLSEDHLDLLGKYFNVRIFVIQSVLDNLFVLDLGSVNSQNVKFIHSDGSHFEEFVYH